jgi:hypothetical protein
MNCKNLGYLVILLSIHSIWPESAASQTLVTIQSFNRQDAYFSYNNARGIIYPANDRKSKELATFIVRKGLAKAGDGYVSFEAAAWPGYFLLYENHNIVLLKRHIDQTFRLAATYKIVSALGTVEPDWFSLQVLNHPDRYIRHNNNELICEVADGSQLYKENATFRFIRPLWDGKNKTAKNKTLFKEPVDEHDESILIVLGILGFSYLGWHMFSDIRQKFMHLAVLVKDAAGGAEERLLPEPAVEYNPKPLAKNGETD